MVSPARQAPPSFHLFSNIRGSISRLPFLFSFEDRIPSGLLRLKVTVRTLRGNPYDGEHSRLSLQPSTADGGQYVPKTIRMEFWGMIVPFVNRFISLMERRPVISTLLRSWHFIAALFTLPLRVNRLNLRGRLVHPSKEYDPVLSGAGPTRRRQSDLARRRLRARIMMDG
jgi:hypothetical protein